MNLKLEKYDPQKHDKHIIAELIFKSDEETNSLIYGEDPIRMVARLIDLGDNYFGASYTQCAMHEDVIVGVVAGYPIGEKSKVDNISGKSFAKAMGFLTLMKKMPFLMKLTKAAAGAMDEDGYYIHTLSVSPLFQSRGVGARIIEIMAENHGKLYLHVNRNNSRAVKFYSRTGFKEKHIGTATSKGRELCQCLMERK
jgi:ribosomal protein S18 acetylase RimI-like enzyme